MLDEKTLELLPEVICRRLSKLNTEILEAVGKSVKEIGKLSKRDLAELNRARFYSTLDIEKELERITGKNAREISEILESSARSTMSDAEFLYEKSGIKYIKYQDNTVLQRYVEAIRRQTLSEYVNLSQNTAFCIWGKNGKLTPTSLSETYNRIVDESVTVAQTGVTDYNQAIRQTLRALADSGLRTVDYATGYSRRLDSAVRQNVLWGIKQCNQGILNQVGEETEADGYEIDYHSNPRPSHAPMGGKMYAIGESRIIDGVYYPPFSDVEELLADYNCLHFATPVILGVSEPSYPPEVLAALKERDKQTFTFEGKEYTGYEATQIQRKLESAIRKQKDRAVLFAASGDDTARRTAQEKINALTEKYADFSKAADLPTKKERLSVAGFRKVSTQKGISTVQQDKNRITLTNSTNSGKIEKVNRTAISRNMANGLRKSPTHTLSDDEIKSIKNDIKSINADESIFEFNKGYQTSYVDKYDRIFVCGDVLPDTNSQHPRDLMSSRAVLAHEYYGHRMYRGTKLEVGSWNDEFRASYMAAKNAPNLSDTDRLYLVLDALERAKEFGIPIKNNKFLRRILYGY